MSPRQVQEWIERGDQALSMDDPAAAAECFRQAVAVDPRSPQALYSLGAALSHLQAWDQALEWADRALAVDPDLADAWALRGNALMAVGQWREAIEALERAFPQDPPPQVLGQLGLCHESLGELEAAEAKLREALADDPSYLTRFDQVAMHSYEPVVADLHHFLARVLQRRGKLDEARLHYHLAKRNDATIELDPIHLEIASDAELDDHPNLDIAAASSPDRRECLIQFAQQEVLPTPADFADGGIDTPETCAALVHDTQLQGALYVSARLRVIGDAMVGMAPSGLFDALRSRPWRAFFELVERIAVGEFDPDQAERQLARLELPADTLPDLLMLTRRFVELDPGSSLVLAEWVAKLVAADPAHGIEAKILLGRCQGRAGFTLLAEETLEGTCTMAAAAGDDMRLMDAFGELADHYRRIHKPAEALAQLDEAISAGKRLDATEPFARLRWVRAELRLNAGEFTGADLDAEWLLAHRDMVEGFVDLADLRAMIEKISAGLGRELPEAAKALETEEEPPDALLEDARELAEAGYLDEAMFEIDEAMELAADRGDRVLGAIILATRGRILANSGDLEAAAEALSAALATAEPMADRVDLWWIATQAADVAEQRGEVERAERLYRQALNAAVREEDTERRITTLRDLSALFAQSDPARSADLFGESLKLASEATGPEPPQAAQHTDDAEDRSGAPNDAQAAIAGFESAAEALEQQGDTAGAVEVLGRAAELTVQAGASPDALLSRAQALIDAEDDPGSRRCAALRMANMAEALDRRGLAVAQAQAALVLSESVQWRDSADAMEACLVLGRIARRDGRYQEAADRYGQALPYAERLEDAAKVAEIRGFRGIARRYLGRLDAAIDDYRFALDFGVRRGWAEFAAAQRLHLSQALFLLGRTGEAIEEGEAALAAFDHLGDIGMAGRAAALLSQHTEESELSVSVRARIEALAAATGGEDPVVEAWRMARKSMRLFEQTRDDEAEAMLVRSADAYRTLGDHYNQARTLLGLARLLHERHPAKAHDRVQEARTIAEELRLPALLAECDELLLELADRRQDDGALDVHLASLMRNWAAQRRSLVQDRDRVHLANHSALLLDDIATSLLKRGRTARALEVQDLGRAQALIDQIAGTDPVAGLGLSEMRALMAGCPGPMLLASIAWTGDELSVFALAPDDTAPQVWPTGIDRGELDRQAALFEREVLRFRGAGTLTWQRRAAPLLAPIADVIPADGTLVLVLEEELQALPLHALPLPGGERLLERAAVVYAPSLQTMALLQRRGGRAPADGLVAAGVSFQDEALALTQRFGGLGLTSRHLDKTRLAGAFAGARWIHMACHGHFDPDDHLESGLVIRDTTDPLARDILSVRELSQWGIAADLVVLSACETGRGQASASEFLGLGRALLMAGAGSVITALWAVENRATQHLMLDFYAHLFTSSPADGAAALRRAQLEAMRRGEPFCGWAAFKLTGWPFYREIET